jgi:hypothetical protein
VKRSGVAVVVAVVVLAVGVALVWIGTRGGGDAAGSASTSASTSASSRDDGLTVLVAHDIDIAPRLDGLRVGDRVDFHGEYVWSDLGGTVHWTHHDPSGGHEDGWLRWQGRTFS